MCLCQALDLLVAGSFKSYVQMSCGRLSRQTAFHVQRLEDVSKRKDNTTSGVESQPERVWAMWGSASVDGTAAARVRLGRPMPGPPACSLSVQLRRAFSCLCKAATNFRLMTDTVRSRSMKLRQLTLHRSCMHETQLNNSCRRHPDR